ncbi:hypothetical protein DPMN_183373 [Dreissena polymorpha]|uniref:Uncharacterized protein n=1 Tax=Dreissena polymorpha TaxID=45954 RepID=A0A9D4I5G6_DREPO|nr:hypothetical protein DPMN_183373 [Dreissena polymorpha]
MKIATLKSTLKRKLQVTQSARLSSTPYTIVTDGCAVLWCIHWPANGTVQDFVNSWWRFVLLHLSSCDVYLIFDRYHPYSIKSGTRTGRASSCNKVCHKLITLTPLPAKQIILTNFENKVQLIDLICEDFRCRENDLQEVHHKLIITGSSDIPVEIHRNNIMDRVDLRTTHEEADVIIPRQSCRL